jgi:hypothetical protein
VLLGRQRQKDQPAQAKIGEGSYLKKEVNVVMSIISAIWEVEDHSLRQKLRTLSEK